MQDLFCIRGSEIFLKTKNYQEILNDNEWHKDAFLHTLTIGECTCVRLWWSNYAKGGHTP